MTGAWVGLDIGTSSSKAVVHDENGTVLASGRAPTRWQSTAQGVQIDPRELLAGAVAALAAALDQLAPSYTVAGLGITSMGETGVLVDGHGDPLAPAIAWHDQRDAAQVVDLDHVIGAARFGRHAGKPLRGQFSLTKHRWLMDHEPTVRRAVRRFNVAEWVARGLGADEACDRVLACRTGWFDVRAADWWDDALTWSGTDRSLMPPLVVPGTAIGRVRSNANIARLQGAVITLAGHDHQAGALGVGASDAGRVFDSCGTAEAIVRTVAPTLTADQVGWLAENGITTDESLQAGNWSLLGGTEGGLAMQRVLRLLGVAWPDLPTLDDAALALRDGDDDLAISGVGTAALTVAGVDDRVGPAHLWRAITRASADAAVPLHHAMTEVAGHHDLLVAAGGWCQSRAYLTAKTATVGPVTVADVVEPGARGAAMLAARATGDLDIALIGVA